MSDKMREAIALSDAMAEDEGLWFIPVTITEDYLQRALRKLCAAIEACRLSTKQEAGEVSRSHPPTPPSVRSQAMEELLNKALDAARMAGRFSQSPQYQEDADEAEHALLAALSLPAPDGSSAAGAAPFDQATRKAAASTRRDAAAGQIWSLFTVKRLNAPTAASWKDAKAYPHLSKDYLAVADIALKTAAALPEDDYFDKLVALLVDAAPTAPDDQQWAIDCAWAICALQGEYLPPVPEQEGASEVKGLASSRANTPLPAPDAGWRDMEARKDAAYLERNQVVAALASAFPSGIARTAIDGWSDDWHGCVYIDLPTGQASWHYHDSHAHLFAHLPPYAGKWDGHTTEEKYERLAALKPLPAPPVGDGSTPR